jgi:hypothetical protein
MRIKKLLLVLYIPFSAFAQTQHGRTQSDGFLNVQVMTIKGASPRVEHGNVFKTGNNKRMTITNFLGTGDPQHITIICGDRNTSIANDSNIVTATGATLACGSINVVYDFVYHPTQKTWLQVFGGTPSNGSGVQANQVNTFSSQQNFDAFTAFKGPNPYVDVTRYGVRAINPNQSPKATKASCIKGDASISLSGIQYAFYDGDGIMLPGCGPTHRMSTPAIISVTPVLEAAGLNTGYVVNAPLGSTQYCYTDVLRDTAWGMTAGSLQACTKYGPASLGLQSLNITGCLRTLNVTSCSAASSSALAVGAKLFISGTTDDGEFGGWPIINSIPDGTHFTYINGMDARNGGAVSSLSGTATYFQGIHVVLSKNPTGAYQHLIYGRAWGTQNFIGYSLPTGLGADLGSDPGYLAFDDWGSAISAPPTVPYWLPLTPSVGATNDNLITTVASGCAKGCTGTVTLTLNVAPKTSRTSTAIFDNGPNIITAAKSISSFSSTSAGGMLFFPPGPSVNSYVYPTNSFVNITADISIGSQLLFGDTFKTSGKIMGNYYSNALQSVCPQFSLSCQIPIYIRGFPGIWTTSGYIQGLTVGAFGNGYLAVLDTASGSSQMRSVNFSGGADSDCTGILLYIIGSVGGTFGGKFENISLSTGPNPQINGNCPAFAVLSKQNTELNFDYVSMNRRGIGLSAPIYGLYGEFKQGQEEQGGIMPMLTLMNWNSGVAGGQFKALNLSPDTMAQPLVVNWSGNGGDYGGSLLIEGTTPPASGMPLVSGKPFASLRISNPASNTKAGQNVNVTVENEPPSYSIDGRFSSGGAGTQHSPTFFNRPVIMAPLNSFFTDITPPAAPTVVVQSGGSILIASHFVTIHPVFASGTSTGAEGRSSIATRFTTTSGKQTVQLSNFSVAGAIGYDVYLDGFLANTGTCTPPQITGSTITLTSGATCGNSEPGVPGGGPAGVSGTTLWGSNYYLQNMVLSSTSPTISSGFGGSPSIVTSNGTAAFRVNVGTGGTASSGLIGLPNAKNGWACNAVDITSPTTGGGYYVKQTAGTTSSVTLTGYNTSGSPAAWTANDILQVTCSAF